jgi:hypothetical protein
MDVTFNKTALIVGAALVVAGLVWSAISTRNKLADARAELETVKTSYSYVVKEKARLDSLIGFYKYSVTLRDTTLAKKQRELDEKDAKLSWLRRSLAGALTDVKKLTADSSYLYLQTRMPSTSEKTYPFDSLQVKTIHYTFIEHDGVMVLNDSLTSYNYDLQQLSSIKDNQILDLKSLNNVYIDKSILCEMQKGDYIAANKELKKDVKKQRTQKSISNIGLLGLVVVIIAIIL